MVYEMRVGERGEEGGGFKGERNGKEMVQVEVRERGCGGGVGDEQEVSLKVGMGM